MSQNRPNSILCTSAGRGQRVQMAIELNQQKKVTAAQSKEQIGQFEDAPESSPRSSTSTSPAARDPKPARDPEPARNLTHANPSTSTKKTVKPGTKCWNEDTINAVVNQATRRKAAPVAGGHGSARRGRNESPRLLPQSTQTVWQGRGTHGRTSLRGYDLDYVESMLEKERSGPRMDEESWD